MALELAKHFESCIFLSTSISVADALATFKQEQKDFAVIVDADQPQAVVQAADFVKLAHVQHHPLSEVLKQLPAPVVVDGSIMALDDAALEQVLLLLEQTNAPGLIVYQDKHMTGVVSTDTIVDALPVSAIPPSSTKNLHGDTTTPTRAYICHLCEKEDPPAPLLLPREGKTPICPKHWLHGPMTPLIRGE